MRKLAPPWWYGSAAGGLSGRMQLAPGKSELRAVLRNDDVRLMSELAREAMQERIGEERVCYGFF